jgi:membrane protease YdiL (CAAX protease family)
MAIADRPQKSFIARKPSLMYFVLSYVFFWLFLALFVIALNIFNLKPDALPPWLIPLVTIFGSWTPTLATLVMLGTLEGRAGIGRLFQKFIHFKIPARWYLAAFIPFGLAFVAIGIYWLAGGITFIKSHLPMTFWGGLILVNILAGPTGEEIGWRGFALPRLLERYTPLKAGIILGIIWDFWHLPLWITSGYASVNLLLYCLYFSIGIISLSVLMTWIFCRTPNSLVPMVIVHFSFNFGLNLFGPQGLGLAPTLPLLGLIAVLCVLTVMLVWATGGLHMESPINDHS